MPERLRREVESFIPERLSAPPRSKLSAMLNWWVNIIAREVLEAVVDNKLLLLLVVVVVVVDVIVIVVVVVIVVVAGHLFGRESGGDNASVYRQEVCLLSFKVIIFIMFEVMITTKT